MQPTFYPMCSLSLSLSLSLFSSRPATDPLPPLLFYVCLSVTPRSYVLSVFLRVLLVVVSAISDRLPFYKKLPVADRFRWCSLWVSSVHAITTFVVRAKYGNVGAVR